MSGAGKSTALNTLEDLGWEVVDNLPLKLLDRLLDTPPAEGSARDHRPLAIGIDSRTRGFDAEGIVKRAAKLRQRAHYDVAMLFLDCAGAELERRYDETRRPHPLATDRPASDGIMRERELLTPLRETADYLLDTTNLSRADLQHELRTRFAAERGAETVLSVMSFGFARGLPRNADLVFDMRFLRNPHWDRELKPMTGLDAPVRDYIAQDAAYAPALEQIEALLLTLVPRYAQEGKAYVTVAFGCTGGRHRSVHCAERVAGRLREAGFSPTVTHRDLAAPPRDAVEEPKGSRKDFGTK
ncbi:MAG: RNase adapter RapZ [Proteobacteria bacterium]|nr:RNase adapter RapZ [Pseudomonadota bacterium]